MTRAQAFLLAARPRTLPASLSPVLLGTAAAWGAGAFRPMPALAAALGAVLIQIGTNLANDVFDFWRGADGPDRVGPMRAAASGLLRPAEIVVGMLACFSLAMLAGAYLVWVGGWPIVFIGILSIASGILYTGGPWPLGYHGLGDLFTFVFFGPVAVGGTYYVQAGAPGWRVLAAGAAAGALTTAILAVNNLRDRASDARAGKRTLAVRLGAELTRDYYALLLLAAYGIAAALASSLLGLLPLLSAPLAFRLVRAVSARDDGSGLNVALAGTARLLALFCALWIPAWL
jgi:1,4-dihydroxy-2-naphthoate octaprenyltransferase